MKNKDHTLIAVSGIHYDSKGMQHSTYLRKHMYFIDVKELNNPLKFDLTYVTNVTVNTDTGTIIQCGGYSPEEGMFCKY